jgi:hypothetical protein
MPNSPHPDPTFPTDLGPSPDAPTLGSPAAAGEVIPRLPEVPGYEVLGELGCGGMGVVLKAGRPVSTASWP